MPPSSVSNHHRAMAVIFGPGARGQTDTNSQKENIQNRAGPVNKISN